MKINTVIGPVDTADLGCTLMHEQISMVDMNLALAFPGWHDREKTIRMFCEEAEGLKACGVRTFVDATPFTVGRDVTLLHECAVCSGLNILTCTGSYWAESPWMNDGVDADYLAGLMIGEAKNGIQGTNIKPAFVKCATSRTYGKSKVNEALLHAAGITARETGLPVYLHSVNEGQEFFGDYQKKILVEEGVDPSRIAFGHINLMPDDPRI